jgi:polyphenol oxidase
MRPQPESDQSTETKLRALDDVLFTVGLARSPRHKPSAPKREQRLTCSSVQELLRPAPVPKLAANGVQWLPVPGWERFPWLWAGFSTRRGGLSRAYGAEDAQPDLNLGFTAAADRETVLANRRLLAEAVTGDPATPLISIRQFHSNLLVVASAGCAGHEQPRKADGLMTAESGMLLAVQTADCIPVLVADRKLRIVAAFHAGWRGTVKRIVELGVGRMRLEFGSRPEDLIAAIGPGVGACCYAVGEEVFSAFESQFDYARVLFREVFNADPVRTKYPLLFMTQRAPGHLSLGSALHLDLVEANRRQLLAARVRARAIQVVGGCTNCHPDLFFSHRASHGHTGRMMAVIGSRAHNS